MATQVATRQLYRWKVEKATTTKKMARVKSEKLKKKKKKKENRNYKWQQKIALPGCLSSGGGSPSF